MLLRVVPSRPDVIPAEKRLAVGIYKLASSAEYRTVGELFGVSEASVHNCLK